MQLMEQAARMAGVTGNIEHVLSICALLMARALACITLAPFLGGRIAPAQVRIGLSIAIAILLYAQTPVPEQPIGLGLWVALLIKELFIGALMGFFLQVAFSAAETAAAWVDFARGARPDEVQAPQLMGRSSALASLQMQFVLVVFLSLDGHLLFIRGLADSLQAIPVLVFPAMAGGFLESAAKMGRITGSMITAALQMSAPALFALFVADLILGLLQRLAKGSHFYEDVSSPLKLMIGIGVLLLGAGLFLERLFSLLRELPSWGAHFFRL